MIPPTLAPIAPGTSRRFHPAAWVAIVGGPGLPCQTGHGVLTRGQGAVFTDTLILPAAPGNPQRNYQVAIGPDPFIAPGGIDRSVPFQSFSVPVAAGFTSLPAAYAEQLLLCHAAPGAVAGIEVALTLPGGVATFTVPSGTVIAVPAFNCANVALRCAVDVTALSLVGNTYLGE